MIILLNGVSSAGKSSIAKSLQNIWPSPLLELGIDRFIAMLPRKYIGFGDLAREGFGYITDHDEKGPVVYVRPGWVGQKLYDTMPGAIRALSDQGYDLVVDEVFEGDSRLRQYVHLLCDVNVYFVAVYCDLDVIEYREHARQNRPVGMSRPQYKCVHGPTRVYDFDVDTTSVTPDFCAQQISDFVQSNSSPQAFAELRGLFDQQTTGAYARKIMIA